MTLQEKSDALLAVTDDVLRRSDKLIVASWQLMQEVQAMTEKARIQYELTWRILQDAGRKVL
jgi:hypothetical protein